MNAQRALDILYTLADGTDPFTGADFPPDSPYQQADTVRALHAAIDALEHGGRQRKPEDPTKPKTGAKWTPEEIQRLEEAFRVGTPFPEIAADHGRTPGAITARLVKLGLIEDNPTNSAGQGNRPPPAATEPALPPSQPGPVNPDDFPF